MQSENFTPAAKSFAEEFDISWETFVHGHNGPVQSSYPVFQFESIKNYFRGWASLGVQIADDPAAGVKSGAFNVPSCLDPKDETRSYARSAHYDRVIQSRPNYHLLSSTAVTKIILDEGTATGVEFMNRESGKVSTVSARKEVILAAGTVHSPQILQLSGIGPKALLDTLGIETKVDIPGVGYNFQDQPTLYSAWNFTKRLTPSTDTLYIDPSYAASQLDLYWQKRQGSFTIVNQGGNIVTFLPLTDITADYINVIVQARASAAYPSLYPGIPPEVLAGYESQRESILSLYGSNATSVQETGWNSGSVMPITLLKPLSRGSILVNSTDPLADPVLDWASLSVESDLDILVAAFRKNRDFMGTPAMQELGVIELVPGANVTTDDDLKAAFRELVAPTYSHPCCTCAMLPWELGGVVGPDLNVHGVKGLRVVDASIMPIIPSAHLSATVYAIAEKAADIIKDSCGL